MRQSSTLVILVLLACFLLLLPGCKKRDISPAGHIEAAERDSIIVFIKSVSQDGMRAAFENLSGFSYRRYLRTEQFGEDDFTIAYSEQIIDTFNGPIGRESTVVQADSGGVFDFGFFNKFVSENVDDPDPVDLVPFLIDDSPSYLNPKNIEKYTFRIAGDTLMWDRSARIIEIKAKPELADGLNIRRVRYYIDLASGELVAMHLERIDLSMLFREESSFFLHVRPVSGGVLVPYNTRFQTLIRTPFKDAYVIRTVSTYTDHRPSG